MSTESVVWTNSCSNNAGIAQKFAVIYGRKKVSADPNSKTLAYRKCK